MSPAAKRAWSLQRRITLAFGLSAFLLSLGLSLLYGWTVWLTIQEEIDALAREELEETKAYFSTGPPTPVSFAEVAGVLAAQHERNPLAWRVWDRDSGALWGEFGVPALLELVPQGAPQEAGVQRLDGARRLALESLGDGLVFGVLVDGSHQFERFQFIAVSGLLLVLFSTGIAFLTGGWLGRRVSALLRDVAHSARTEDSMEAWPPPAAAPAEIQEVVRALQDTLRRIRAESENAQLITSGMAHELRSPLQNLMGETQVTLLRERDAAEYRRVLESQLEELGNLSRVVDNLVTLCSPGSARRRPSIERFDLGQEARLRLTREFQLARRRDVTLTLHTPTPLVVEGDREALLLALRNVVTNAIEWSPAGQTVEVRMNEVEGGLEILVDDAGPGVPQAARATLFEPFRRRPAAAGRRAGFGLGLALTHSAVLAHDGEVEVGDSPLGGARIQLFLPQPWRRTAREEELADEAG